MEKKMFLIFLCSLLLSACSRNKDVLSNIEDDSDEVVTQDTENILNVDQSRTVEFEESYDHEKNIMDEQTNNDTEIMDNNYRIRKVINKANGDFVSDDESFWIIADYLNEITGETEEMYILTDVYEHKYKVMYGTDNPIYSIKVAISDDAWVVSGENSRDYYIIDSEGNDISLQYINANESIIGVVNDDNGISIFAVSTEDTYTTQNVIFKVYDENKNCKFSFSKKEIVDKYGIEWQWDTDYLDVQSIGNNTYYIDNDSTMCDLYLFVDTTRKKAFPMSTPQQNGGVFSSDGTHILYYSRLHGCIIIDIDNEVSEPLDSIRYKNQTAHPDSDMWNGKFIAVANQFNLYAIYDYQGNLICELESESVNVTAHTDFHDGYALIELVNDGGISFVTVINDHGEWQFEPIQGSINNYGIYLEKSKQFLVWENDQNNAFLIDKTGQKESLSIPGVNYNFIVTEIDGEMQYLFYGWNNTEKFIRVTSF